MATKPQSQSTSRRAVLAAALGGAAAMLARTAIQPSPARAAGDDNSPILVGSTFLDVRTGTYLSDAATDVTVLSAVSSSAGGHGAGIGILGASGSGTGVRGTSDAGPGVRGISGSSNGVSGSSSSGTGVVGTSTSGNGMLATSTTGVGVYALSASSDQPASFGWSNGHNSGVQGSSGGSTAVGRAKTGVFGYAADDSSSRGVVGESPAGHGIHGESDTGWAGYFDGRIFGNSYLELSEQSNPSAPSANHARLFVRDNGSGHTQLCVRFHNGVIRVLATA
jgi:hypothetical protein